MTDQPTIPVWDPATFKPTHTTSVGRPVMETHRFRWAGSDYIAYVHEDGCPDSGLVECVTPIPELVTAREQWGGLDSLGRIVVWADDEADARRWAGSNTLVQLKAIDGRLVLCDEHGNPVQVEGQP
jgi:hypothetical protein